MPQTKRTDAIPQTPVDLTSDGRQDPSIVQLLITSKEGLEEIREPWNELAQRCSAMIQSTADWNLHWWTHFGQGDGRSLFVSSYWTSGRLVGLCPWYIGVSRVGRSVLQKRVRLIGSGSFDKELFGFTDHYGISDFLDILAEERLAPLVANRVADQIQQKDSSIDYYQFLHVRDDSFIMRHLMPELKGRGVQTEVSVSDHCPTIRSTSFGKLDEFIASRPSGHSRRRIRQSLRAVEDGTLTIESISGAQELSSAFDELVNLHQRRWNRMGMPGVFHDPRFTRFSHSLFQSALQQDRFIGYLTRAGEEVVAVRFALVFNARVFDFLTGFSDDHPASRHRPGIVLLTRILEQAIQNGYTSIELLRGTESYKFDYTDEHVLNHRVEITTPHGHRRRLQNGALILYSHLNRVLHKEWILLNVHLKEHGARGTTRYLQHRLQTLRKKTPELLDHAKANTRSG